MNRAVWILRAGEAIPEVRQTRGDFPGWIRETSGDAWKGPWRTHDLRRDADLPALRDAAAFIITGSAASVTERAAWMLRTEEYVRGVVASGIPLLGICFGHQLMAQALGGLVARNPRGRELGTVMLEKLPDADEDALFSGLPRSFAVNTSHVDTVVRPPDSARVLARTDRERVAAFGLGGDGQLAWGVQFHPEFDGEVVRGYVRARSPTMAKEGLDPERALESAADAPHGREILRKFLRTVF